MIRPFAEAGACGYLCEYDRMMCSGCGLEDVKWYNTAKWLVRALGSFARWTSDRSLRFDRGLTQ